MTGSSFIDDPRFDALFPTYIVVGRDGRIVAAGQKLVASNPALVGSPFKRSFSAIFPSVTDDLWKLSEFESDVVVKSVSGSALALRGQLLKCEDINALLFAGAVFSGDLKLTDSTEEAKAPSTEIHSSDYRFLVEDATDIIYKTNSQGNFVYANPMAIRVLGTTADKVHQLNYLDLIADEHKEEAAVFYQKQFKDRTEVTYYEFPVNSASDGRMWIGQNVRLIEENGWVVGFHAVARDITAARSIQEELRDAKEQAEQSVKARQLFLANMSHEIRTPLNAILGMSQLLEKTRLDSKQLDYLDAIYCSSEGLMSVIDDLLDISMIESGKLEFESIPFNPYGLFEKLLNAMEHKAYQRDNLIERDIQLDPNLWLIGDPTRFHQVARNLVDNAVKFTENGTIKVTCTALTSGQQCTLTTSISDTGIGIEKENMEVIFDAFNQTDDSFSRKYEGTGLGLTISQQVLSRLGGSIDVSSEVGKGSTFSFTIDFTVNPVGSQPDAKKKEPSHFNFEGMKALIVEDHDLNQIMARSVLEAEGIIVDTAENGEVGVAKIKINRYDFVLMDIQMPVMDGMEATRIIREELNLDVPIIALTANALKGNREKYLAAGMNEFLAKPYKGLDLKRTIATVFSNSFPKVASRTNPNPTTAQHNLETQTTVPAKEKFDLSLVYQSAYGNRDFVVKMIEIFLVETPEALLNIRSLIQEKNWDELRQVSHKLKSSVKLMGVHLAIPDVTNIELYALERKNLDKLPILLERADENLTAALLDLAEEMEAIREGKELPPVD